MRHALAVVIATICRDSLIRAVRSIYAQKFSGKMQILIGVDCDPDNRAATLKSILEAECPENISLLGLIPGIPHHAATGAYTPACMADRYGRR